jgi:hypothetical protein
MLRYLPVAGLAVALLLSACGGGDDATSGTPSLDASPLPDATATAIATQQPDATATATATQQPSGQITVAPPAGPVSFESVTSPVDQGDEASVAIQTSPDTGCSILVIRTISLDPEYTGTATTFEVMMVAGLEPTVSDESGLASWTWQVETETEPDMWRVDVTCGQGAGISFARSELEIVERQ